MRLGEIRKGTIRQSVPTPAGDEPAYAEPAVTGRALVALTPVTAVRQPTDTHHQACFLAQLIATKDQHPQTRDRRRAEPHEVIAAYRATAALTRFQ